jgi:hypothetical protein
LSINIDITDCKSVEIIKIMQQYPFGSLTIKNERVYWVSDLSEAAYPRENATAPRNYPGQQLRKPTIGERMEKAQDALGRMVCGR